MILCSGGMSDRGITLREWCDPFFIVCEQGGYMERLGYSFCFMF